MIDRVIGSLVLVVWAAVMVGLSYYVYLREEVTDSREFIIAGGRVQLGLTTASFAATWMWSGDILGVPQYIASVGISGIWMYAAPAVISSLVMIPMGIRMRRQFPQGLTYSEYFRERFGPVAHLVVVAIVFYTMVLGGVIQLYVGGEVIGTLTNIGTEPVMAFIVGVVSFYVMLSGLWASMTTDFLQFTSSTVLTLVFAPILVFSVGGPDAIYQGMVTNLDAAGPQLLSTTNFDPIEEFFLPFVLGLGVWGIVSLSTWQRVFAVRRDRLSRFLTIGGIGVFTTIAAYSFFGFVGLAVFPDATPGNLTIRAISLLPTWALVGFVLVALMVLASSVDSYLTAIAGLVARDVYHCYVASSAEHETRLLVARVASLAFGAVILVAAIYATRTMEFITLLLLGGVGATALVGPFTLSLFWKRTCATGFVAGVVVSQVATGYLLLGNASLPAWTALELWKIMLTGHVLSTGITISVTVLFPDDFEFDSIADDTVVGTEASYDD